MVNHRINPPQHQIEEQAALWMLLKEEGLTAAQRRRYEAWLKLPYRAEALRRMEGFNEQVKMPWRRRRLAIRLNPWNNRPPAAVPG
ncbi:MAG TPA: hypothetical protein VGE08_01465 [Steroidobacter sp.]|uniref:hypothetical protein n=1 Tax=Steroidobacter sp. TaxID=1978227 RepID=UPI002EDAB6D1